MRQGLLAGLGLAALVGPLGGLAATVWTGPRLTRSDGDGPDQITPRVALTRGGIQGLFNSVQESGFSHFLSPKDTEWANGTTANYASLFYTDWNDWAKGVNPNPPSTVGVDAVLHLKTDDIYLDIKFLSWAVASGGYAYERSTPGAPPNNPPAVALTSPVSGAAFAAPATVTLQATASDPDGTIAGVEFWSGATSLGTVTTPPYGRAVSNLAAGTYSFTAIATDNAGLSATATVVSVTVVTPGVARFDPNLSNVGGALTLRLSVTPGLSYAIDSTSTFTTWTPWTNFVATNAIMSFLAPITPDPRFFRGRLWPNP